MHNALRHLWLKPFCLWNLLLQTCHFIMLSSEAVPSIENPYCRTVVMYDSKVASLQQIIILIVLICLCKIQRDQWTDIPGYGQNSGVSRTNQGVFDAFSTAERVTYVKAREAG